MPSTQETRPFSFTIRQQMYLTAIIAVCLAPIAGLVRRPGLDSLKVAVFSELIGSPLVALVWIHLTVKDRARKRRARRILWVVMTLVYVSTPFLYAVALWAMGILDLRVFLPRWAFPLAR